MRSFLVWRDDWLLGIELLDEQNLKFVEKLNELHSHLMLDNNRQRPGANRLCRLLAQLLEMARRNFQNEEGMMRAEGYHGLSGHHREHVLLLAELHESIRGIESGSKPFTLETLTALKFWLIDHALNSDRLFIDYLDDQNFRKSLQKSALYHSIS
ncbi:MAG: hemerythrin domain-containing protein [Candidatus Thiodiazotropha sp.]|jgi:hemerythrin